MARVAHAFDIDLRCGNVAGATVSACATSANAIGDAFRQFNDFCCQARIGKNSDAHP